MPTAYGILLCWHDGVKLAPSVLSGYAPSKEDVLDNILAGIPDNDIKLQVMYVSQARERCDLCYSRIFAC